MTTPFSTPDIAYETLRRLKAQWQMVLPVVCGVALLYLVTGLSRALFPGLYTFDPFDKIWLLMPEALVGGPLIALLHHRLLAVRQPFAWSRENLFVKLLKASVYYYLLSMLFAVGLFVSTQAVPALIGFVLGPSLGALYPVVVIGGVVVFLLVYVRLILVYPFLAGAEREPLVHSMLLTRGKTRQIASCLLLLSAPVLIPWIGAAVYGGDWLNPSLGPGIPLLPIIARTFVLTLGALLLSSGACVIYEALLADAEKQSGESD
ncbi:MAG: hypothetical protein CL942_02580 [Desulfovibrio sp.]|nr:hypothetical protein [Desulfovibrio sp.]|tara:strand:- start:6196 stop:6981 length:786 start_codon:yes stop_codon:yes gene_type:complete